MSRLARIDRSDGWVTVTIDRPDKRNALSIEVREAVADVLDELAVDDTVRCVILTGAGDYFSAGFDLKEFETAFGDEDFAARLWASSDRWHRTLLEFPLPLIAAVNGPAIAGGFDIAVCCDVRVVSTTATFSHPELSFGDVVYGPLRELVGGSLARELCLTGKQINATEAHRIGLANELVDPDQVMATAEAVAERTCGAPREVLLRTKAKVIRHAGIAPEATLDL
jgi:enoyl-CoA hydratase